MVQLENHNLLAVTETRWDELSCLTEAGNRGPKPFRRDRLGRRVRVFVPCVKEGVDCEELSLSSSHEQVESLWVKI